MAPVPFNIDTEAKALIFLSGLVNNEFDLEEFYPDYRTAKWAKLNLSLKGDLFNSTLPTSAMRGLVEFQQELYKSISVILYDDDRVSKLTDADREQFELLFRVENGSTNVFVEAAKFMGGLAERAVDRMNSRHIAIAGVLLGVLYFGEGGFERYLTYRTDISKVDQQTHRDDQLVALVREQREQSQSIIDHTLVHSEEAQKIIEQNTRAMEALVKAAQDADGATIQGKILTKENITQLNESQRVATESVHITRLCKVSRVDAKTQTGIFVRFDPVDGSPSIRASLSDPLLSEKFKSVIEKATFSNETISVTLTGRRKGDLYIDTKIINAHKPRQRKVN